MITLQKAGLGSDVIKSKIQSSSCNFDLSTDALINLKKMKVPDDVISAMIASTSSIPSKTNEMPIPTKSSYASLSSGIYYFDQTLNQYIDMDPSILSNQKDGGLGETVKRSFSGLFNSKTRAVLNGATATLSFTTMQPQFLFVFDTTARGLSNNALAGDVKSPSEFFLVRLTVNKGAREVVTGKGNSISSNSGIEDKNKILFTSKKLKNGVFEVTPSEPLNGGEYGFMFATAHSTKVYDFNIK